jgi:hypothetical protein
MVYYSLIWQVWDLIKLADYLTQREDIDPSRIGITGISLGGWLTEVERNMSYTRFVMTHHLHNSLNQECMHGLLQLLILAMLWLLPWLVYRWHCIVEWSLYFTRCAYETTTSNTFCIIYLQGFRWAIDNDKWQGRVDSIKPLFEGMIMYCFWNSFCISVFLLCICYCSSYFI